MPRTLGILVFDEVEVLDFAGPFEVFAVAGRNNDPRPFRVLLVGDRLGPIMARNGFSINPHHSLADCPPLDLLLVPGGYGTRRLINVPPVLEWVAARSRQAELTLSVCTGALVLGQAGVLDGLGATTHHLAFAELRRAAPRTIVHEGRRWVDEGRVVTSGGVAAGIDMAFHIVSRLLGEATARETADYIEYPWKPHAAPDPVH